MGVTKEKPGMMLPVLAAILGNVIWGLSSSFTKIGMQYATPAVLLAWRFCVATLVLWLYALVRGIRLAVPQSALSKLPLLGIFQPLLYFISEEYGILSSSAAFCSVVLSLAPVVGLIAGALILHEKASTHQVVFSSVSIVGVAMITLLSDGLGAVSLKGALLLLMAVSSGTVYFIVGRGLSDTFSPYQRTFYMAATGAIGFTIWALMEQRLNFKVLMQPITEPSFLWSILFLSILSTMIAYLCTNYASSCLDSARFTAFINLNSIVGVLAGVILLHERFPVIVYPFMALTVLCVYGVQKFTPEYLEARRKKKQGE